MELRRILSKVKTYYWAVHQHLGKSSVTFNCFYRF